MTIAADQDPLRLAADGYLMVSAGSPVVKVSGAIAKGLAEQDEVNLRAIGAGAVNQMVKAVAVAGAMRSERLDCFPSFSTIYLHDADGKTVERTAITLNVRRQP